MAITTSPMEFTPEYQQYKMVKELTDRFNSGELDYLPQKDIEQIAMNAAQFGTDFKPKSKPVRKALFDFVDTTLLGLLPDRWRPTSVGEEYFGESKADEIGGTIGTLGGFIIPGVAAAKGLKMAKGGVSSLWNKFRGGAQGGGSVTGPITSGNKIGMLNQPRDQILIGGGTRQLPNVPRQLPNVPRQLPNVPRQLPNYNYNYPTTSGMGQTVDIMSRGGGYRF